LCPTAPVVDLPNHRFASSTCVEKGVTENELIICHRQIFLLEVKGEAMTICLLLSVC
jgi:hypothetical protein